MTPALYVKKLLLEHPSIKAADDVHINFIGMNPQQFSIEQEPVAQVVKRYLNGDTIRVYSFALRGLCDTLSDKDRLNNSKLYHDLSLWLEGQKLPPMYGGARAMKIEAVGGAYLESTEQDADEAIYMMQIQLTYYQRRSD